MMNLGALSAGIDRPAGTPEESFRLYEFMMIFIEGATIANYLGDKAALEAKVRDALAAFDREFVTASVDRRRALLARCERGDLPEGELPRDVLTVLLRNVDELALTDDIILRETAFYLLSGAHTTATSFTRTVHQLLDHCERHPETRQRIVSDERFVQRAVHEVLRLEPPSPLRRRRATRDCVLADGRAVAVDQYVDLDLIAANRDRSVFGPDADEFDPDRVLPRDIPPWGTSFGTGMHACIGQDLAAGCLTDDDNPNADELLGLVPLAVQSLFRAGVRRSADDPPVLDELTSRGYFRRYPVELGAA
jgi:cytochrome P450